MPPLQKKDFQIEDNVGTEPQEQYEAHGESADLQTSGIRESFEEPADGHNPKNPKPENYFYKGRG